MMGYGNTPQGPKGPSVTVSHTAGGVESVYTGVSAAFPRSAKPRSITFLATAAFLVYVQGNGSELLSAVVAPNVATSLDVSSLPATTALVVNFEGLAAGVCAAAVYYQ